VTIGMFAMNQQGVQGSIVQMISHGLVSGALFLCVGVIYDRIHTREIDAYGGLVERMPVYAFTFMLFTMATIGLPGTSGFVGEFLILVGIYQVSTWVAFVAATGVVLAAAYSLWLYRRVVFGELTKANLKDILDMDRREIAVFAPLIIATLWFGIYPMPLLDVTAVTVENLIGHYNASLASYGVGEAVAQTAH
ncbi:MAG TPA: proton-conducting transporter membrane subunit, partial [Alphaproteobacteria bacterium]|nr:proton-conducting transporter membrane subunit [Alphaproteobacteria bacterium]